MSVNAAWSELTGLSKEKLNAMTIVGYTGAEISALSSTAIDGQIVYCTTTGSGFTRGHWYGWDDSLGGGTWIDLVELPTPYDIFSNDDFAFDSVTIDRRAPNMEQFTWDFSGTGATVNSLYTDNSTQFISLKTGTTSTGWASIFSGGIKADFGKPMVLHVKFKTDGTATTGQIAKIGCNIDRAGLGPSNRRNWGIEWCDGDGDFQIHSGNGTSQSNFDTAIAVASNTTWAVAMYFDPGNTVNAWFNSGSGWTQKTKSTFIPSSGASTEDGIIKISISNNSGNTTSRELRILGVYMVYFTNDSVWV